MITYTCLAASVMRPPQLKLNTSLHLVLVPAYFWAILLDTRAIRSWTYRIMMYSFHDTFHLMNTFFLLLNLLLKIVLRSLQNTCYLDLYSIMQVQIPHPSPQCSLRLINMLMAKRIYKRLMLMTNILNIMFLLDVINIWADLLEFVNLFPIFQIIRHALL